jgi:hypothetical protein
MSRSTSRTIAALLAGVVLAAVVALAANAAFGRGTSSPEPSSPPVVTPSPEPSDEPTPPSEEPSEEPSEQPSEQPTEPPTDGPTKIALENLTGHDVFIAIDDDTGTIVDAQSGTPGDGMSVRWLDVKVENIDADTLRVVWVGLPRDEVVYLDVSTVDGKIRLRFVQDGPPPYSDAIGFDRILELSFDQPVRSEDVLTSIQEGLDT